MKKKMMLFILCFCMLTANIMTVSANEDTYISEEETDNEVGQQSIEYRIYFDANQGQGGPMYQNAYTEDDTTGFPALKLSTEEPIRTGYRFLGWASSKTAEEASYRAGDVYQMGSTTATLYAVWEKEKYLISYNANGGTGAPSSQVKVYDSAVYLSSQEPTREGYIFLGWSKNSTSKEASYAAGESYTEEGDVTLYAVWKNPNERPKVPQSIIVPASSYTKSYGSKPFLINAWTYGGANLTFSSSNPKVAAVSPMGQVSIKGYGVATITINATETWQYLPAVTTVTVKVVPPKASLKSVKSPSRKKIALSWKKNKSASGYEIYVSTKKDFSSNTIKRSYKKSTLSKTISGWRSKQTYYVKVRTYKKVGKTRYYGAWSNIKKVKVR